MVFWSSKYLPCWNIFLITFLKRYYFLSQIDIRELMIWTDEVLFIKFSMILFRSLICKFDKHNWKEELNLLVRSMQNVEFNFNHTIEIHLILQSYLNFLLSLSISLDLSYFSYNVQVIVTWVMLILDLYLSIIFIFVVDKNIDLSAFQVN